MQISSSGFALAGLVVHDAPLRSNAIATANDRAPLAGAAVRSSQVAITNT